MKCTTLLTVMAAMGGVSFPAQRPDSTVTVYLRENGVVPLEVRSQAKAGASEMFATIGIRLIWRKGDAPARAASDRPLTIELDTDSPPERSPRALAESRVFEGVHITVFYNRVAARGSPGALLAHVFVHEITHILMGLDHHSASGVMKAHWTVEDFSQMKYRPLAFTEQDVKMIRRGLAARAAGVWSSAVADESTSANEK